MNSGDGAAGAAGREGLAAAIGEGEDCRENGGFLEEHHIC